MRGRRKRFSSAESGGVRKERFLGVGSGGHSESFKGYTHTAVALFDGAVDRQRNQYSKATAQWEHFLLISM